MPTLRKIALLLPRDSARKPPQCGISCINAAPPACPTPCADCDPRYDTPMPADLVGRRDHRCTAFCRRPKEPLFGHSSMMPH